MAEDTEMTPVADMTPVASEPPKVNPLAKPSAPGGTVKLTPMPRKPVTGATVNALKPGLKLPPKPALSSGLKLPPKPGATANALKPGLKLPPKPGATVNALKPGLKLPPKPVIHKPGATVSAAPLPKPVVPVDAQGVGKLPTVEAKPIPRDSATEESPAEGVKPLEALKSVTQKLKGITQPIPQQAILRKTGIIAEGAVTEAQKEAAKHKTARISLSDAMGVAPVKNERAPMKTIRIKRPVNIGSSTASLAPQPRPEAGATSPAPSTPPPAPSAAAEQAPSTSAPATSITQRKTLKIARPGGAVRPSGRFGKTPATVVAPKPQAAGDDAVADIPDMPADIPSDIPPIPAPAAPVDTTPSWLYTLSAILQFAACVAMGVLAWFLYQNTQTLYF